MSRIEVSVEIKASPEKVFGYFTIEKMPLWYGAEAGTRMLTCHGRDFRRGTVVQFSGRIFGRDQAYGALVTDYQPNRSLAFQTVNRDVAAEIAWKLEPVGAVSEGPAGAHTRTRVTMVDHFHLPGNPIGWLFDRLLVAPMMRANDRRFMQNLKRLAEAGAEAGGTGGAAGAGSDA